MFYGYIGNMILHIYQEISVDIWHQISMRLKLIKIYENIENFSKQEWDAIPHRPQTRMKMSIPHEVLVKCALSWALKSKLLCGRSCWARPLNPITDFWNTNSKNRFLSIYYRKIDENCRKGTTNASTLNSFTWQQCLKEIIN